MPQTSDERRARWPGSDAEAQEFLKAQGYKLKEDWSWNLPTETHLPTKRELDAVIYLIEEWDYDGLNYPSAHPVWHRKWIPEYYDD